LILDVAKVDPDVAYVAIDVYVCCKSLFKMFHLFYLYVASVYIDIAYVSYVANVCLKCFSCFRLILNQVFHVAIVEQAGCMDSRVRA